MNWDIFFPALLAAVPATILAGAAYRQAGAAVLQAKATHLAVNSRMDELLVIARAEAGAQATLKEKAAENVRKADAIVAAENLKSS